MTQPPTATTPPAPEILAYGTPPAKRKYRFAWWTLIPPALLAVVEIVYHAPLLRYGNPYTYGQGPTPTAAIHDVAAIVRACPVYRSRPRSQDDAGRALTFVTPLADSC